MQKYWKAILFIACTLLFIAFIINDWMLWNSIVSMKQPTQILAGPPPISSDILKYRIDSLSVAVAYIERANNDWRGALQFSITAFATLLTIAIGLTAYYSKNKNEINTERMAQLMIDIPTLEKRLRMLNDDFLRVTGDIHNIVDGSLIAFNNHLPKEVKLDINCLKFVLQLWHFDKRERFVAISTLGEIGDRTIIPYLERIAANDKEIRPFAMEAINKIRSR